MIYGQMVNIFRNMYNVLYIMRYRSKNYSGKGDK